MDDAEKARIAQERAAQDQAYATKHLKAFADSSRGRERLPSLIDELSRASDFHERLSLRNELYIAVRRHARLNPRELKLVRGLSPQTHRVKTPRDGKRFLARLGLSLPAPAQDEPALLYA